MSEEEKKAITYLKFYIERDVMYENTHYEQIKTILNLVEQQAKEIARQDKNIHKLNLDKIQQQKEIEEKNMTINKMAKDISIQLKEIEELKKDNNHQWEERCRLAIETDRLNEEKEQYKTMGTNAFVNAFVESNYISKDKIKAKIQELEEEMKELLEE